jgi:hypothetical protein
MPLKKQKLYEVVWQVDGVPATSIKVVSKDPVDAVKDVVREEALDVNTLVYLYVAEIGDIWA